MRQREYPTCIVTNRAAGGLRAGHPWLYESDLRQAPHSAQAGDIVDVLSPRGKYLGSGFFSPASKIRIRVFSQNANDTFDAAFWQRRVHYALVYRKAVLRRPEDFSACRLIFGEADQFPGLTVDRFCDVLVAQVSSVGMERYKDCIFSALVQELRAQGEEIHHLYERNDAAVRRAEGLEPRCGFWCGEGLTNGNGIVEIKENGIRYTIDYIIGQKTGFFLDQKYNRAAVAHLARGRRVLDCFTHTGAFALNAVRGGAEHVTAVDISADAMEQARYNAALNDMAEHMEFVTADVFAYLEQLQKDAKKGTYDFIILDPPAFTKSQGTVQSAFRGYLQINTAAMRLVRRGGLLASCSCSHFMTRENFEQMLREAAYDAGVHLRLIEQRAQAPDHPILFGVPQTEYLKFYLFQVV